MCFVLFCFELPLHRVLVWSLIGLKVTAWPKRRKKTSNKKKGRAFWGRGRLQQGAGHSSRPGWETDLVDMPSAQKVGKRT